MSAQRKTLGFVILTWNSERVIGACLRSIFAMEGFRKAVVVVDNGSTDGSVRIVEELLGALETTGDDSLEVLRLGVNRGTAVSRNLGLRALGRLSPDYYCILDSDTQVNAAAFETMIRELEQHADYGLIGPAMVSVDGRLQNSARSFPTLTEKMFKAIPLEFFQQKGEALEHMSPAPIESGARPADYLMSACWLLRPALLERAGYLDERFFYAPEDAEYCIRVWKSGYQVVYCPDAVIVHEWQRLSRKKYFSRLNWEHIKGLAYMFWKHRYLVSGEKLRRR